jgi:poly(3-hydroxybutyrate) depolymerase
LIDQGKDFPFIVVSPQSAVPDGWDIDNVYKLLQTVKKNYRIDDQRIYLTGLSMGGFGTWALAIKYPEEFAAIAPICGGGDIALTWKIRNIPVWCFHGVLDNIVPPSGSENMVRETARFNPNVRFTLYSDKAHNSWDTAYSSNDSLYQWLMAQTKFRYEEVKVNQHLFKRYEGWYVGDDNDTVQIIVTKSGLTAIPGKDTVILKTAGENLFFLRADKNMDIRFISNGSKITSFWFLGDRKLLYRRIK